MSVNYASILKAFNLPHEEKLQDTLSGFSHEIGWVMFDYDSPFESTDSSTEIRPTNLNSLILCKLKVKPGISLQEAIKYLISTWYRWLRYSNPVLEHVETKVFSRSASVRILAITSGSACTVQFVLKLQQE